MPRKSSITDYVFDSYKLDLGRFAAAYRGDLSPTLPDERGPGRPDKFLFICDANIGLLREALSAGLHDPRKFAIVFALEATLFAGVHCYDEPRFKRYVDLVKWTVYVEAHAWSGVRRPHVVLAGVTEWGSDGERELEEGWAELLPRWARLYDQELRTRTARDVVRGLANDSDVMSNPYGHLPDGVVGALRSGLRKAVARIEMGVA